MSDQNMVVVNNVKKRRRDHLLKGHGWDRPSEDIRMPVSSGYRGGESVEDGFLRRSGTPRGRPSAVQQCA
jgi:hypothetical protein